MPSNRWVSAFSSNTEVGREIAFKQLQDQNDAVYIAYGDAVPARKIGIEGEQHEGRLSRAGLPARCELHKDVHVQGIVAVIGGGSTAFDAARVAKRMGAAEVHVLYPPHHRRHACREARSDRGGRRGTHCGNEAAGSHRDHG